MQRRAWHHWHDHLRLRPQLRPPLPPGTRRRRWCLPFALLRHEAPAGERITQQGGLRLVGLAVAQVRLEVQPQRAG